MELVNGDVARGWREQERGAQQTGGFSIKSESLGDVVANQRHCRERSVLHRNKKHRVTKNCEERCKKKNDRFDVVAQQGNVFNRHIQTAVNQLPDRLDIIGQVERPILEIRPAGIGRPGADEEEQGRKRGNDYLTRLNCLPLSCDHLELPRASSFGWFLFAFGIVRLNPWRKGWDSNPRWVAPRSISSRVP